MFRESNDTWTRERTKASVRDKDLTRADPTCDSLHPIGEIMARQTRRGSSRPGILTRDRKTSPIPVLGLSCALILVVVLMLIPSLVSAQTTDVEDVHVAPPAATD